MGLFFNLLAHPLTRGMSVDDPRTTLVRREIIRSKTFLHSLYREWYRLLTKDLVGKSTILEIGSGAGFLSEFLPDLITSEVFQTPGVQLVADGQRMPFAVDSLDAIVMTDVFHHLPDVSRFLHEAARCIRPGGKVVMIEPWRTPWSEWVYTHLHTEPFLPHGDWIIPSSGPLSGANGALPWIVFQRDRAQFARLHPQWRIVLVEPLMPFAYLASGGMSMRSLFPGWAYRLFRAIERCFDARRCGMFAMIELERVR